MENKQQPSCLPVEPGSYSSRLPHSARQRPVASRSAGRRFIKVCPEPVRSREKPLVSFFLVFFSKVLLGALLGLRPWTFNGTLLQLRPAFVQTKRTAPLLEVRKINECWNQLPCKIHFVHPCFSIIAVSPVGRPSLCIFCFVDLRRLSSLFR